MQHRQVAIAITQTFHHAKNGMNARGGMDRTTMMIGRKLRRARNRQGRRSDHRPAIIPGIQACHRLLDNLVAGRVLNEADSLFHHSIEFHQTHHDDLPSGKRCILSVTLANKQAFVDCLLAQELISELI